jgi:hypothetical protein
MSRLWCVGFIFILSILLVSLLGHAPAPIAAAGQADQVVVSRIDASQFPNVQVNFSAVDTLGDGLQGLTPADLDIQEDGTPFQVTDLHQEDIGTVTAILIDASGNLTGLPGKTGKIRFQEAQEAIFSFTDSNTWLDKQGFKDWFTVLVPDDSGGFTKIAPRGSTTFTNDYNLVHNEIYLYQPPKLGDTPLFRMLFQAIKSMGEDPTKEPLRKSIIVFSDGVNVFNDIQLQDAANQANAKNIRIYTVFHGPSETASGQGNPDSLRRLALLTSARYTWYTSVDAMQPVYNQIASLRKQYTFTYRSKVNSSGSHLIHVGVLGPGGGKATAFGEGSYAVTLLPPTVSIVEPDNPIQITKKYPSFDSKTEEGDPKNQHVTIAVNFPDNFKRKITQVEYISDGKPLPASDQLSFDWDISSFVTGPHSLRVRVTDELGIAGQSDLLTLNITEDRPAAPVPPPPPPPDPTAEFIKSVTQYISLGALAISLSALALAVFIYFRSPRIRETVDGVTSGFVSKVKEITEPFFLDKAAAKKGRIGRAFLEVVSGVESRDPIDLIGNNTRIGRDASLANVVFDDRSVSRLHARISEEQDGIFKIYDEGSTSGTYVNYEPADIHGQWLQNNDTINLGRIQLRFRMRDAVGGSDTGSGKAEATEPFIPDGDKEHTEPFIAEAPPGNKEKTVDQLSTEPFIPERPKDGRDLGNKEPFFPEPPSQPK